MNHPESSPPRDPFHNQPLNTDTISHASKILLKGPGYSCLMWGYASAWQIQKWMFTVIYWMEHGAPNEGPRKSIQGAKRVCNPIGRTMIWTNQYSPELFLVAYIAEDGLVGYQWEERPLGIEKIICPSTGECQGQKAGVGGLGNRAGGQFRGLWG